MRIRAVGFFCASLLSAADPQLVNLVPPGPTVLAGVNVTQARSTPFGAFVLARLQENEQSLQQLTAATGFDPRVDIGEILVASTAQPGTRQPGLVLVRGKFDVQRIAAAATQKGLTSSTRNGATILTDARHGNSIAFADPTLAIGGLTADVQAALDRRASPAALDPAVAARINQLSTTQDAWALSLVSPPVPRLSEPLLRDAVGNVAASIQQASAGVKFGADVRITADALAATSQDAQNLASLVRLLAVFAQSNTNVNQNALALLQGLAVTTTGSTVQVSLAIPEDQFEALVPATPRRP